VNSSLDNVYELIRLGYGDTYRLEDIKQRLANGKVLYASDNDYLQKLVSQYRGEIQKVGEYKKREPTPEPQREPTPEPQREPTPEPQREPKKKSSKVRMRKHSLIIPIILTFIFPLLGCYYAYKIEKFWIFSGFVFGTIFISLSFFVSQNVISEAYGAMALLLQFSSALLIAFLYRRWNNKIEENYASGDIPRPRQGWTPQQKEEIREQQYGKCAHCGKSPPRWEYHHIDGDRSNGSMDNCEGLCPNCHSIETHEG